MDNAVPDLQLPSQSQNVISHWLVPNYTGWWWGRRVCEQHRTAASQLGVNRTTSWW